MERIGIVVEVKENTAVVKMQRHLACEHCGSCGGIFGQADRKDHLVEVKNTLPAKVGQRVFIEADSRQVLFIAFVLYMVPLFALIIGIAGWLYLAPLLGVQGNQDLPAIGAGFVLLALVFCGIRWWDRRVKKAGRYRPEITGLAEDENGAEKIISEKTTLPEND